MKRHISRSFTLLEVVITIILVGIIGTWGFGSLQTLLSKHRYRAETEQVKSFLQELQLEALVLRSDIEVHFVKQDHWSVSSKSDESILRSETIPLKQIRSLLLNGQTVDHLTLMIFSTGRITPSSLIELKGKDASLWIDLREPIQLKFTTSQPPHTPQRALPKNPKKSHTNEKLRV